MYSILGICRPSTASYLGYLPVHSILCSLWICRPSTASYLGPVTTEHDTVILRGSFPLKITVLTSFPLKINWLRIRKRRSSCLFVRLTVLKAFRKPELYRFQKEQGKDRTYFPLLPLQTRQENIERISQYLSTSG